MASSAELPDAPRAFTQFPQTSELMTPCRFEGEVQNLEILGSIPKEINGIFYRVMPDPQFPAFVGNDPVSRSSDKLVTLSLVCRRNKHVEIV